MPATPQDHKPKADAPFTFRADGKTYKLPKVSEEAAMSVPGDVTYDVVMKPGDEMAQMRLAFATLEACKPSAEALTALKSLPTQRMLEVVGEWMGGPSGSSD
jgi:hypothetical protein